MRRRDHRDQRGVDKGRDGGDESNNGGGGRWQPALEIDVMGWTPKVEVE
jgi:hypothetical protein